MNVTGPGTPYALLFDDDNSPGPGLPPAFQAIYGGDWRLPAPGARPYLFSNFVVSHDGRTSFGEPGHEGGGAISRHSAHDRWLMGLLRARADAVITGATTLRHSPGHTWTAGSVFPTDAGAFAALRAVEGRSLHPLLVLLTSTGAIAADTAALTVAGQQVLIATTAEGARYARATLGERTSVSYHIAAGGVVELPVLVAELRERYGVATLLSEGGARIYGLLLHDRLLDDTFLTLSPVVVGNPAPPHSPRTGLVEGLAFSPLDPPIATPLSLRRAGDLLFQRSRYNHKER